MLSGSLVLLKCKVMILESCCITFVCSSILLLIIGYRLMLSVAVKLKAVHDQCCY